MMSYTREESEVIQTAEGPIRGYVDKTEDKRYYRFKSIPYAKPPVGNLRFLPPSRPLPWTTVKDCTKDAPMPHSYSGIDEKHAPESEDCLYVEVSSPDVAPDKPLPVMFWIGCYAFARHIDAVLDPTLINDQQIVFVRCGFRLGAFGFLSTNDFSAPGNCGPKDIVMSLKWVQRNISKFGGDPNNVTVFGNSSGGAIVHLLMLSPMATGLFHKAIIQSITALNNWSLEKNPSQPLMQLARELGITTGGPCYEELLQELRKVSAEDIMNVVYKMEEKCKMEDSDTFQAIFKPCIEEEYEGQSAFLTKNPYLIIKSGNFNKVPLIIGSNNTEGSAIKYVKNDFYTNFEKLNENVHLLVPKPLAAEMTLSKKIGLQLLKFYLGGDEALTKDTKNQYIQLLSDYYFLYFVNKTVRLHSEFAPECPIYYYVINFAGEWLVPEKLSFFNNLGHFMELAFLFAIRSPDSPSGQFCKGSRDSIKVRSSVIKMWTNFAKYGNPTPDENDPFVQIKWDPVENKGKLNYLSIAPDLTKGRNPFQERMAFWDDLYKEHTVLRLLAYFSDLGVSW